MRNAVRYIAINFVVFVALLLLLNVLAITFYQGLQAYRTAMNPPDTSDPRARLPNYAGVNWADTHFSELSAAGVEYQSFYGWRRLPFDGQTITVDERGIRPTPGAANPDSDAPLVVFLGGSTMWGEGADNENTIPAHFTRNADMPLRVENLGESAYTAFQGYLFLRFRMLDGWRPDLVISYDGINNVGGLCRAANRAFGHGRELQMREAMRGLDRSPIPDGLKLTYFILPLKELISRLLARANSGWSDPYRLVCHEDLSRAIDVARHLLDSWVTTKQMVEVHGGHFVAVLQPVAYLGTPTVDHLSLDPIRQRNHEAVYELVRDLLGAPEYEALREHFVDLTDAFDDAGYTYIDSGHLSPEGNDIIAQRLLLATPVSKALTHAADLRRD